MSVELKKSELFDALSSLKPYALTCLGISFFLSILYLAPIGYMRDVYGPVINSRSLDTLGWVTALLVLLLITTAALDWLRQRVLIAASVRFSHSLSNRIFDATFKANLVKHPAARLGLNDLRGLRVFISSPLMGYLFDAPFGLFFLVLIFLIHPTMGYLSLLGAALALIIGLWTEKRVRPIMTKASGNANLSSLFISDSSRNAQVIHAMGMMGSMRKNWLRHQNNYLYQQASASNEQALGSAVSRVVMMVQGSALLGVGTLLTLIGHLPASAGAYLIIAKLLGAMAIRPTMQVISGWKQIVTARESYDRLEKFLLTIPKPSAPMSLPAPSGALTSSSVGICPPGTKRLVASNLNLRINPGNILAIVGPSGSGKSSIAKALVGVWHPVAGSVRLDGVDISNWDKSELGEYIGYLPQDVELFDGTVAENISRFGLLDEKKLDRVIKIIQLENFLNSLPEGVNTAIGDDGSILSGGQRQRIGIARALYGDPRLVVMDEPNSSLDQTGEAGLEKSLIELKQSGSIVIVITHRKNILQIADQILVMLDGRPRLYGQRDAVIAELKKTTRPNSSRSG